MILDIDVGNSRIKWLIRGESIRVIKRGVSGVDEWTESMIPVDSTVSRVRISSVKGDINSRLKKICLQQIGVMPEFARVVDGVEGLACGYSQPGALGIDRWLAVLACWKNIKRRALIVDAGSAMTIDVLSQNRHLGGYIIPGLPLMCRALGAGTWGVRAETQAEPEMSPANGTSGAVHNGSLIALIGAVNQAAKVTGIDDIVLTGGDSGYLKKNLASRFTVIEVPDLVLDGLAIALP